ncbi:MAG: tRNA lysidine(34) synthetase TilS [Candidatus Planktophila sp.]
MTRAKVEILTAVRPYLEQLTAGDVVLVAVSGGADSLALAAAILLESKDLLVRPIAVTIDHQLQIGSAVQAEKVVSQLKGLGYSDVISRQVSVDQSSGLESGARDARYAALHKIAEEVNALHIYLGHTRDDQAETVLLGLARGSGARSLSGMASVNGKIIRPLLHLTRQVTEQACKELGCEVWNDPHNFNNDFTRVRVRTQVLPLMEKELGPGISEALARTASLLRDDADALDTLADQAIAGLDMADLDINQLSALPRAVRTRVLRRAIYAQGAPSGSITADHVSAVEALVTSWHGQGEVSLPGGVKVARISGRLSLYARS